MKCEYVETHNPVFHCGKNHGQKLFCKNGLELEYDLNWPEFGEKIKLTYNGKATYLPMISVQNFTPAESKMMEIKCDGTYGQMQTPPLPRVSHPMDLNKIKTAQVSGPHDHVFQGEGAGRKRNK